MEEGLLQTTITRFKALILRPLSLSIVSIYQSCRKEILFSFCLLTLLIVISIVIGLKNISSIGVYPYMEGNYLETFQPNFKSGIFILVFGFFSLGMVTILLLFVNSLVIADLITSSEYIKEPKEFFLLLIYLLLKFLALMLLSSGSLQSFKLLRKSSNTSTRVRRILTNTFILGILGILLISLSVICAVEVKETNFIFKSKYF